MVQVQLGHASKDKKCVPSGSDGTRALLAYSVRYLGQRDADFLRLHESQTGRRVYAGRDSS